MEFVERSKYENCSGVYYIVNTINNKVYIGKTARCFKVRYFDHKSNLQNGVHINKYLQADYNSYGSDAFKFIVYKVVDNDHNASKIEQNLIRKHKETDSCYNITTSIVDYSSLGNKNRTRLTGSKLSDAVKKKMSDSRKGKTRPDGAINRMTETKAEKYLNGETTKVAKISAIEVAEIKTAIMNNVSYEDLASKYGVTYSNVNAIRSNRSWKFVKVDGWDEYCSSHIKNRFKRTGQSRSAT